MFFRKPTTVQQQIRAVRRSAVRTMFLVVLLVSGFSPALCMWWDYRGEVPWQQQWNTFLTVGLRTYPLTLSVAIIAMSRQRRWFKYGRLFFMAAVITAGAALGDLVATFTGQRPPTDATSMAIKGPNILIAKPLFSGINQMVGYYQLYGARHFLAAILIGSFAGRTASKLIQQMPQRNRLYNYLSHLADNVDEESADRQKAA